MLVAYDMTVEDAINAALKIRQDRIIVQTPLNAEMNPADRLPPDAGNDEE